MSSIYGMRALLDKVARIPGAMLDLPPQTSDATDGDSPAERVPDFVERAAQSGSPLASARHAHGLDGDAHYEDDEVPEDFSLASPVFHITNDPDAEAAISTIGQSLNEHYQALVLLRGIDALGYYVTFHQRAYQWGIYLPLTGVAWMAATVLADLPVPATRKLTLAAELILAHERFHYAADCAVAQMEVLRQSAIYARLHRASPQTKETVTWTEEECANAAMLRAVRHGRARFPEAGLERSLRAFVRGQPPGYRAAIPTARTRFRFENRMLDLMQAYWEQSGSGEPPYGVELQHLVPYARPWDLGRCPIFLIDDQRQYGLGSIGIRFISAITHLEETPQFERALSRLGPVGHKRWGETKRKLRESTMVPGLDFKRWAPGGEGCFSVRLTRNWRAHIRMGPDGTWQAEDVGSHAQMGHE